ncbi:RNA polymerase II subunit M [Lycorma delicatula]|uniref:RNA polymerase II subunit M n=1 Tax=Lycorma delicatula TaxID=130591 RepID=UPI003F511057
MSRENSITKGILEQVIHKVPGNVIQSKKEKQGFVNLSEKNKTDILELIERQDKLLRNQQFIKKLADNGEKIINYKKQLEEELRKREKSEELSNMLLKLNINGKEALDKLEWTGNCNPGQSKSVICEHDDDDGSEQTDVLKIIATHSGTGFNKKINRVLPPQEQLIKPSDIECISESDDSNSTQAAVTANPNDSNETFIEEPYIKNLLHKFDRLSNERNIKERFLPHRTLKHDDKILSKDKQKTKKTNWEVTAATPPPPVFKDTKLLPLEMSVKLQVEQAEKLKEVQLKHATEKLKAMSGQGIGYVGPSSSIFTETSGKFRDSRPHYDSGSSSENDDDDDDKQSFHNCNDDEDDADEKRDGIVFYNIIDN